VQARGGGNYADVEARGAVPPEWLGPEHRTLRKRCVKGSRRRRIKAANGERFMIAIVDPMNSDRAWLWIRNNTLEDKHDAWLIDMWGSVILGLELAIGFGLVAWLGRRSHDRVHGHLLARVL
jgi:hypothetical protein